MSKGKRRRAPAPCIHLPLACLRLNAPGAEAAARLEALWPGFVLPHAPPGLPCMELRLVEAPDMALPPAGALARNGLYTPRIRRRDRVLEVQGAAFLARILLRGPGAGVEVRVPRIEDAFTPAVLENALRICCAFLALERGGLLLHSAALLRQGLALVLAGRSGAGKSTLGGQALAQGLELLSDDLNLVLPGPRGWEVHATPFGGDHAPRRPGRAPLRALALLEQGERTRSLPLSPARAVAALAALCPFVNQDDRAMEQALGCIEALVLDLAPPRLVLARNTGALALADMLLGGMRDG